MTLKLKYLASSLLVLSSASFAASHAIEARGDAMGGTGVVSANYLTAPFYNPALVAIYRRNDDLGMIIPGVGLSYNDPDNIKGTLDDIGGLMDRFSGGDLTVGPELQTSLDNLENKKLNADVGATLAFGIPNRYMSMNLFGKSHAELYALPSIATGGATVLDNAQNSTVDMVTVAITEVGLSLAKYQTFMGQHVSFGISPKLQYINTYVYEASVNNYDIKDADENGKSETTVNMDFGFLWFYGPLRVGLAATNLISQDIETARVASKISGKSDLQYAYKLEPLYTVGVGLIGDYASVSVDYDLNEEERYEGFDDNTQMLRLGGEIDLRQLKFRAGYKKNLAYSGSDGTVTAGIGISILGLQVDLSGNYTNPDAMGASVNFLAAY